MIRIIGEKSETLLQNLNPGNLALAYREAGQKGDQTAAQKIKAIFDLEEFRDSLGLTRGDPKVPQLGGLYGQIRGKIPGFESHHIPAASIQDRAIDALPTIAISKEDHKLTDSYTGRQHRHYEPFMPDAPGSSPYKAETERLIANDRYVDLVKDEIYNIRDRCGNKYDGAISQYFTAIEEMIASDGLPSMKDQKAEQMEWEDDRRHGMQKSLMHPDRNLQKTTADFIEEYPECIEECERFNQMADVAVSNYSNRADLADEKRQGYIESVELLRASYNKSYETMQEGYENGDEAMLQEGEHGMTEFGPRIYDLYEKSKWETQEASKKLSNQQIIPSDNSQVPLGELIWHEFDQIEETEKTPEAEEWNEFREKPAMEESDDQRLWDEYTPQEQNDKQMMDQSKNEQQKNEQDVNGQEQSNNQVMSY